MIIEGLKSIAWAPIAKVHRRKLEQATDYSVYINERVQRALDTNPRFVKDMWAHHVHAPKKITLGIIPSQGLHSFERHLVIALWQDETGQTQARAFAKDLFCSYNAIADAVGNKPGQFYYVYQPSRSYERLARVVDRRNRRIQEKLLDFAIKNPAGTNEEARQRITQSKKLTLTYQGLMSPTAFLALAVRSDIAGENVYPVTFPVPTSNTPKRRN